MPIKQIISAVAITLFAGTSYAWNLVYSHDANGNPTGGSLQTLRTALSNGSNIKVHVNYQNTQIWAFNCTHFAIKQDATQAIVCLSGTGLGIDTRVGATFATVVNPPNSVHYATNTLGQYVETNVGLNGGAVLNRVSSNYSMQWFVD